MPNMLNSSATLGHALACFRQASKDALAAEQWVNRIKIDLEAAEYAARQANMAYTAARQALLKAAEEDSPLS